MRSTAHGNCPTRKVRYYDKLSADMAIARIQLRTDNKHEEQRSYYCKYCVGWHLTKKK